MRFGKGWMWQPPHTSAAFPGKVTNVLKMPNSPTPSIRVCCSSRGAPSRDREPEPGCPRCYGAGRAVTGTNRRQGASGWVQRKPFCPCGQPSRAAQLRGAVRSPSSTASRPGQVKVPRSWPSGQREAGSPVSRGPFPPQLPWDPNIDPVPSEMSRAQLDWELFCLLSVVSLQDVRCRCLTNGPARTAVHRGCQQQGEKPSAVTLKQSKSTEVKGHFKTSTEKRGGVVNCEQLCTVFEDLAELRLGYREPRLCHFVA